MYILDTRSLLDVCLGNIFSHAVACSFIFFMIYFEEQKFIFGLSLIYHSFTFKINAFCVLRNLHLPRSLEDFLLVSFRNFTVQL